MMSHISFVGLSELLKLTAKLQDPDIRPAQEYEVWYQVEKLGFRVRETLFQQHLGVHAHIQPLGNKEGGG